MKKKILIVAAHPDDEILGCAGTVARLIKEGYEAHTLILGEGVTSRDTKRDAVKRKNDISSLRKEVSAASKLLGIKNVIVHNFPDNRFDSVAFLDIVKVVERAKADVTPSIIFTHYHNDLNIDHRITYEAVITAARPLSNEAAKEIYSFEVLSSTDWKQPSLFSPDVFFDINNTLEKKVAAMKEYRSELREYPHPRSLKGIRLNAEYWGMRSGLGKAEAFKSVRIIK